MPQCARFRSWFVPTLVLLNLPVAACTGSSDDPASAADRAVSDAGSGAGAGAISATVSSADAGNGIVVNSVTLTAETVLQLQQLYPVPIAPGRYWYDVVSGAYGREGEPIAGQMLPGLQLGGPLSADASRGTSGVFINRRQITAGEVIYIERLCQKPVVPGRYWIAATGIGGYEGEAPFFNLGQCPGVPRQNDGPHTMSRTYCDANGACTTSGILGTITTAPP